jgi:nucleoside-diphosphate-sugar epimerase
MKHLVLGSSGQVGYHLVNVLKQQNQEVLTFDIIESSDQDLRLYNNILLENKIQECDFIHFLAFDIGGSVYLAKYQNTFEFISNNIKIMNNVFDLIKKYNKPFIFASSQMSNMSYSTYGVLKAIGERYTEALGGLIVKFWNVYGYEQDEEKSHVITDFIKMAKKDGIIKMRTNGEEVRQFLYGDDCAECLIELSKQYNNIERNKQLHITNFKWNSILEIATLIQTLSNCSISPSENKDTVQLDKRNEPDPYILNFWQPTTSLKEGIIKIYNLI